MSKLYKDLEEENSLLNKVFQKIKWNCDSVHGVHVHSNLKKTRGWAFKQYSLLLLGEVIINRQKYGIKVIIHDKYNIFAIRNKKRLMAHQTCFRFSD